MRAVGNCWRALYAAYRDPARLLASIVLFDVDGNMVGRARCTACRLGNLNIYTDDEDDATHCAPPYIATQENIYTGILVV